MRIYVLSASAHSGKTITLNALAHLLDTMKPKYAIGPGCPIPPVAPNSTDGQYWFDTVRGGRKVRVGIYTAGDSDQIIRKAFGFFNRNACDVCFVASRTWGLTIDEIERQAQLLNTTPRYLYLIVSTVVRTRSAIQADAVQFMESLI